MEGAVETDLSRRGMFPISFVHMLADWLTHSLLCYIYCRGVSYPNRRADLQ
jgi:hypothetical protein